MGKNIRDWRNWLANGAHQGRRHARLHAELLEPDVFSGFEIWNGGVGLETTDFAVTVKCTVGLLNASGRHPA